MNLLKQAQISAAIGALSSAATKVQQDIHLVACSTLDHAREFGDFTGCERLLNALPNGQRVKSLGQWFNVMSSKKLSLTQDPKTKQWSGELATDRKDSDFKIAEAIKLDYGSFQPEIVQKVIDLKALVKKMEQVSTNDKSVKDKDGRDVPAVTAEARAAAAQVVAFMRSLPAVQGIKAA